MHCACTKEEKPTTILNYKIKIEEEMGKKTTNSVLQYVRKCNKFLYHVVCMMIWYIFFSFFIKRWRNIPKCKLLKRQYEENWTTTTIRWRPFWYFCWFLFFRGLSFCFFYYYYVAFVFSCIHMFHYFIFLLLIFEFLLNEVGVAAPSNKLL